MTVRSAPQSGDILWNLAVLLAGAAIYAAGTLAVYRGGLADPDVLSGHIVPFRPPLPSWWYQPQSLEPHYISTVVHRVWGAGSIAVVAAAVALSLTTPKWRRHFAGPRDNEVESD